MATSPHQEQLQLFDCSLEESPMPAIRICNKIKAKQKKQISGKYFQLKSRRYLGNKHKLLDFIEHIVASECGKINSFCDIFAGTGVVGERFNSLKNGRIKIISNDLLKANFACINTFLGTSNNLEKIIAKKIDYLNSLEAKDNNYFSEHFGGTYFSENNARKIGLIREEIEHLAKRDEEKFILICSLIYAADKVANTVGHYDAFRKKLDSVKKLNLLIPNLNYTHNLNNEIYNEDANKLIHKISCDVLYIDPPYNSRQYSDAYHLLENLSEWKTPKVFGVGKKMDRAHIKSDYCLKNATSSFEDLIKSSESKYILLSYNNTANNKNARSNARMEDTDIIRILSSKGQVKIFETVHKAFSTGKSNSLGNTERIFLCKTK